MIAKVAKLSLCECGFLVLNENIGVGAQYDVDPESASPGTMQCGGCGTKIPVTIIKAAARGESHGGIVPADIFDFMQPQ